MKTSLRVLDGDAPPLPGAGAALDNRILRLVKRRGPERRALAAGQIDAVIDPATGKALLLPEAQAALQDDEARLRSLLALSADWCWEQDEFYRFVSHTGAASGGSGIFDENIIGKTLRDLPSDSMSEADWQTHRRLLDWRATFRDVELRCMDRDGVVRWVSISGEPTFDVQDQFTGYRGTMRDITLRKQLDALAQKPTRFACDTLDALAVQVCVLDSAGTVVMANKPSGAFAAGSRGIGAVVPEGGNYLKVCDEARGTERADGAAIATGIRQVIAGELSLFRHEYACDAPAGWCRFNLTVTYFPGDGPARVVVAREDVTERKREKPPVGRERNGTKGARSANGLLAALPPKDHQRLLAGLEPVTLEYGDVLYEPGDPIRHVYFPVDCLVSLLTTVDERQALEVGLVGHEGMVGLSLALGISVSPVRALVQGSGTALRMPSARFSEEFGQCLPLQQALYRHAYAMLDQVRQTAACNRFHDVDARLARWLLMTRDRVQSDEFALTQEFLADMLGVRRGGVTHAASALKRHKLIDYSRGKIRILDRKRLEAASCRCYRKIKIL